MNTAEAIAQTEGTIPDCPLCNLPFPWNKQPHNCVKPEQTEWTNRLVTDARKSFAWLIMSMPDTPVTKGQFILYATGGTPREFAEAVVDLIGELSIEEARLAIADYRREWDMAL